MSDQSPSSHASADLESMRQDLEMAHLELQQLRSSLEAKQQEADDLRQQLTTLELAVRGANDGLWNWNLVTNEAYLSPRWKQILGYEDHELANHLDTFSQVLHPDDAPNVYAAVTGNIEQGLPYKVEARMRHKDGSYRWVYTRGETLRNEDGTPVYMAGALSDITERKQAEEMVLRAKLQEEVIEAQNVILSELSTPVIPITERMMVMPLIGTIDSRRAQQIIETLLQNIVTHRAATVILDITGVKLVDTQIANVLIRAAQSAQLLGSQVILTGVRPEVAQTMVSLGIDLQGLITHSSLQQGISMMLSR